jgi:protein TonB
MTPRLLVPTDIKFVERATAQEKLKDGPTRSGSSLACESRQASFALPNKFFEEAMLENSPTKPPRRLGDFVVSATVQVLLLATLLLLPLFFSEALDIQQLDKTLLAAPPLAPAPPPPPALARSVAPKRRALPVTGKLFVPRVIPNKVTRISEDPAGDDLAAAIDPGEGVPGGVPGGLPGGVPGGVIGGALSGAAHPPAPIVSGPKSPIRVGGKIESPRLIFGPEPVFPVLARQARIAGAVVIDAVIDTQGNVAEMRTVSGHPLLALAAMEALRRWKYEPTILGGEAIPVRLLVTITFESRRS